MKNFEKRFVAYFVNIVVDINVNHVASHTDVCLISHDICVLFIDPQYLFIARYAALAFWIPLTYEFTSVWITRIPLRLFVINATCLSLHQRGYSPTSVKLISGGPCLLCIATFTKSAFLIIRRRQVISHSITSPPAQKRKLSVKNAEKFYQAKRHF